NTDDNCNGTTDEPIQIYNYTDNTSGTPFSVSVNATGSNLTRVNGAGSAAACTTGFSSKNFTNSSVFNNSLPAIEFTITPLVGYQLSVTSFSAGLRRSNSGPVSVRFAYSLNNGNTWIDQGTNQSPNNASCGSIITATW